MVGDGDLIRRSQAGDQKALGPLIERYAAQVRTWAARKTRTPEDADDVAQEAMLVACRRLHQLRDPSRFPGWLRRITLNVAASWHRRRAVQLQLEEDLLKTSDDGVQPPADDADPSVRSRIRQVLVKLSTGQRQVVVHHYLKGYTYGETANLLGLDVTAVRSRLQKARTRLRKELIAMGKEFEDSQTFELEAEDLDVLCWVSRFVSDDRKRAVLCTICLDSGGTVVGCDGARLLKRRAPGLADLAAPVLLGPLSPLDLPEGAAATLDIGVDRAVLRPHGSDPLTFPVMEGPYVQYEKVIPSGDPVVRVTVELSAVLDGLDAIEDQLAGRHPVDPCSEWHYAPQVVVNLATSGNALSFRTTSYLGYRRKDSDGKAHSYRAGVGPDAPPGAEPFWSFETHVPVRSLEGEAGEALPIGVNPAFFRDAVSGLGLRRDDQLDICFTGPLKPIVCTPVGRADALSLVMPLRLELAEDAS